MAKLSIESKKAKLQKELLKLEIYEGIRENVINSMNWECMLYHNADEEHENTWFTAPDPDDYRYEKYQVYESILSDLDEFFVGK